MHYTDILMKKSLKPEKDRVQLSLIEGEEYQYFFFVTNTELSSENIFIAYEKPGNWENYIKEAKCDMAVGHLLLKSFWANKDFPFEICVSCCQNN